MKEFPFQGGLLTAYLSNTRDGYEYKIYRKDSRDVQAGGFKATEEEATLAMNAAVAELLAAEAPPAVEAELEAEAEPAPEAEAKSPRRKGRAAKKPPRTA